MKKIYVYRYMPYPDYYVTTNSEWSTNRRNLERLRNKRINSGQLCGAIAEVEEPARRKK